MCSLKSLSSNNKSNESQICMHHNHQQNVLIKQDTIYTVRNSLDNYLCTVEKRDATAKLQTCTVHSFRTIYRTNTNTRTYYYIALIRISSNQGMDKVILKKTWK
jgi:hypothetical protein